MSTFDSDPRPPAVPQLRLLIISHVWPFPGFAGQELRVRHIIEAAVRNFRVDFLTVAPANECPGLKEQLAALGCRPIILASLLNDGLLHRLRLALVARFFALATGLKKSNYFIGKVDLSPDRVRAAVIPGDYDTVFYEYFHAVDGVSIFQKAGVPVVLDMHNILWKSREQRYREQLMLPVRLRTRLVARYRRREEAAWDQFDGLVAINRSEMDVVTSHFGPGQKVFYAPMGVDLSHWPRCWDPAQPVRLGYYGSLGGAHNEVAALRCYQALMPKIWQRFPAAELWLIGSNPSPRLRALTRDSRIKVTGYVTEVGEVLRRLSLLLCPWSGTYGFRSRIVEVMALGVPVVASPEAVDGMELHSGQGIVLGVTDEELAARALELLEAPDRLAAQSHRARYEMERLYSVENTYDRLMTELRGWSTELGSPTSDKHQMLSGKREGQGAKG